MVPPGRNDPCPCGSGRKYKKCCLAADAAPAVARVSSGRESGMPKLLRFAYSSEFDGDHAVAHRLFWLDLLDKMSEDEARDLLSSDDVQAKYHAWFVWDLDIDDHVTVADLFVSRKGGSLAPSERAYIDRMRRSCLALYQVERIDRGEGLLLRDLLSKEQTFVRERLGTEQVVPWDVLGARVVANEHGVPMFEGGVYLYPTAQKSALVRYFKRSERQYRKRFPSADRVAFFKRYGMVFNHLWLDLVVLRQVPRVQTPEGDELMFTRSIFDIVDEPRLRAVLASAPDIERDDPDTYVWNESAGATDRTLGVWRINGGRLTLETMSRARDERGRQWLQQGAPALATYRGTKIETVAQALAAHRDQPSPAVADELPADFKRGVERQFMDEYYRKWLDEPVPALRGATPREAAASHALRPLLVDLLRDFDNHHARAISRGEDPYDTSWLKDELGVVLATPDRRRPVRQRRADAAGRRGARDPSRSERH